MKLEYLDKIPKEDVINNTKPAFLERKSINNENWFNNWRNILVFGENLNVLKTFYENPDFRGKIKLVYIDPPFATDRNFIDLDNNHAYSDKLNGHEYVEFIRQRLIFLYELLSDEGSIYIHLDQKKGHYIKIILDEIFGDNNFRNDITRIKCNPKNFNRKAYGNIKDVIYFYSKTNLNPDLLTWNDYRIPLNEEEIVKQFPLIDTDGRRYATNPLHAPDETNGLTSEPWKGLNPPKGRHWRYAPSKLSELDEKGLIVWSNTGNPRKKIFAEDNKGKKIQDVWEFKDKGIRYSDYPTEKNEELLKMIIQNSSNKGDIILDCFAGSGTTLIAAEKFERKWIGIDNSPKAIEIIQKRLSELKISRPYELYTSRIIADD